jgi:hypothetical protein
LQESFQQDVLQNPQVQQQMKHMQKRQQGRWSSRSTAAQAGTSTVHNLRRGSAATISRNSGRPQPHAAAVRANQWVPGEVGPTFRSSSSNGAAVRKLHQEEDAIAAPAWDCSNFIDSIFLDKKGGLGKWIAGGLTSGSFCLDVSCSLPVQLGPVPTEVTVAAGACLPWLEYADLDGYQQVRWQEQCC